MTLKQVWKNPTTRMPFIIVCMVSLAASFSPLQVTGQFTQQILTDIGFTEETVSSYIRLLQFTFNFRQLLASTYPFSQQLHSA